ncbi:MAG: RHS repeat-associated core domain-containing protein, partial [Acidobacteriota bacterium]|nr:RHS repeat-associated core domain-containing protein [Acidobacteriota bacterium]
SGVSGYTASLADGPAQKFTGKERDNESGLDYIQARYFRGAAGRFTSVDPYEINREAAGAESQDQREELLNGYIGNPQVWNRYSYVRNNPLAMIDPDERDALWVDDKRTGQTTLRIPVKFVGAGATKQNIDTIVKRVHSLNRGGSPVRIQVIPTNRPIHGVLNTMDFSPGLDMKNYAPVGEGTNTMGGNKAHINSSSPSGTDAAAHDILHFAGIEDQYTEGKRDSSGNRRTTPTPGYDKTNIMTHRYGTKLKPGQIQEAYANWSTKHCTTEQDGTTTCR